MSDALPYLHTHLKMFVEASKTSWRKGIFFFSKCADINSKSDLCFICALSVQLLDAVWEDQETEELNYPDWTRNGLMNGLIRTGEENLLIRLYFFSCIIFLISQLETVLNYSLLSRHVHIYNSFFMPCPNCPSIGWPFFPFFNLTLHCRFFFSLSQVSAYFPR